MSTSYDIGEFDFDESFQTTPEFDERSQRPEGGVDHQYECSRDGRLSHAETEEASVAPGRVCPYCGETVQPINVRR
jgi:DNA-directed RNA polymerase subunit RPC12/RpoP